MNTNTLPYVVTAPWAILFWTITAVFLAGFLHFMYEV